MIRFEDPRADETCPECGRLSHSRRCTGRLRSSSDALTSSGRLRVVHRPDADGRGRDPCNQPSHLGASSGRSDPLGQIEPGVGAKNGDGD
jgi:hypothetical protein